MSQTNEYLFKPNFHWNQIKESTYLYLLNFYGDDRLKVIVNKETE